MLQPAFAQTASRHDAPYHFVANTRAPDDFLALRTHPTSRTGLRIMAMRNGALLQVLNRRPDGWWFVRVVPTGEEGWALSGQGDRQWIACCATASMERPIGPLRNELVGFRMPSNNIYCQLVDVGKEQYLQCDMRETAKRAPARPHWSDREWGYAFKIAHADPSGVRICHGDTVQDPDLLTLDYGQVWRRGGYICKAETVGVTCINDSGHGFSLSRNSQSFFNFVMSGPITGSSGRRAENSLWPVWLSKNLSCGIVELRCNRVIT